MYCLSKLLKFHSACLTNRIIVSICNKYPLIIKSNSLYSKDAKTYIVFTVEKDTNLELAMELANNCVKNYKYYNELYKWFIFAPIKHMPYKIERICFTIVLFKYI